MSTVSPPLQDKALFWTGVWSGVLLFLLPMTLRAEGKQGSKQSQECPGFLSLLAVPPQMVSLTLGSRLDYGPCSGAAEGRVLLRLVSGQSTVSFSIQRADGLLQEEQTLLLFSGQEVVAAVTLE